MNEEIQFLDMSAFWSFIKFNVAIARKIWIDATIILSEIYSEYKYFHELWQLQDGWFFLTVEKLEEKTTLSRYQQSKSLAYLQMKNLVEVKQKWVPAKRYVKLNINEMISQFSPQISKNLITRNENPWPLLKSEEKNIDNKVKQIEEMFEDFWNCYPLKKWKSKAKIRFIQALKKCEGGKIILKAKEYAEECRKKWTEEKYIKRPEGWLNSERFLDWEVEKKQITISDLDKIQLSKDDKIRLRNIQQIENPTVRNSELENFIKRLNK